MFRIIQSLTGRIMARPTRLPSITPSTRPHPDCTTATPALTLVSTVRKFKATNGLGRI